MNSAFLRFNFYLLALVAAAFGAGCASGGFHKKQISTLELYLECLPDGTDRSKPVPIFREHPVMVNVESDPFLTAANLSEAQVVTSGDTFQLRLQFNQRGTWLLEQYSARYPQKRFAIFSQWGEKLKEGRWLAAPKIPHRISDGVLVFTPDATREEAEQIALGLNNLEHELSK
jgi:preprotein translocase subunit SecD